MKKRLVVALVIITLLAPFAMLQIDIGNRAYATTVITVKFYQFDDLAIYDYGDRLVIAKY